MNIFKVLSQGNGRLNECNLSAMLAFLLNPQETHGFGDVFLRDFLNYVALSAGNENRFDNVLNNTETMAAEIALETPYQLDEKKRIIDIEIVISVKNSKSSENEDIILHRIAIENKIKTGAAESNQLKEEFEAIQQDVDPDEAVQITMVFLTPHDNSSNLITEYENLTQHVLGQHQKAWLFWADKDSGHSIHALIKQILINEADTKIAPINEYVRHTLKAFCVHLNDNIGIRSQPQAPGDIIESATIQISDGKYRIDRHKSTTIRIFNIDTQEIVISKPVLRKINKELQLGINLKLSTGRDKNTRNLGKQILRELFSRNKNLPAVVEDE